MVLLFEDGDMVVVVTEPTSFRSLNDMEKIMVLKEMIDSNIRYYSILTFTCPQVKSHFEHTSSCDLFQSHTLHCMLLTWLLCDYRHFWRDKFCYLNLTASINTGA